MTFVTNPRSFKPGPRTLGKHLLLQRELQGRSQRSIGFESGLPSAHISQIETGTIPTPGIGTLIKLATAYDISLEELGALTTLTADQAKAIADAQALQVGREVRSLPYTQRQQVLGFIAMQS